MSDSDPYLMREANLSQALSPNRTCCEHPTAVHGGRRRNQGDPCGGKCRWEVKERSLQRRRQGQERVPWRGVVARNRPIGSPILAPSLPQRTGSPPTAVPPLNGIWTSATFLGSPWIRFEACVCFLFCFVGCGMSEWGCVFLSVQRFSSLDRWQIKLCFFFFLFFRIWTFNSSFEYKGDTHFPLPYHSHRFQYFTIPKWLNYHFSFGPFTCLVYFIPL